MIMTHVYNNDGQSRVEKQNNIRLDPIDLFRPLISSISIWVNSEK